MKMVEAVHRVFFGDSDNPVSSEYVLVKMAIVGALMFLFVLFVDLCAIYSLRDMSLGEFGDFMGGVLNPFLTFLTFIALLITVVLQQRELRLAQREMRESTTAIRFQAITSERQLFEFRLFALLDSYNGLVAEVGSIRPNRSDRASVVEEETSSIVRSIDHGVSDVTVSCSVFFGKSRLTDALFVLRSLLMAIHTSSTEDKVKHEFVGIVRGFTPRAVKAMAALFARGGIETKDPLPVLLMRDYGFFDNFAWDSNDVLEHSAESAWLAAVATLEMIEDREGV